MVMKKIILVVVLVGTSGIGNGAMKVDEVALMAGALLAEAEECRLPTAPIEDAMQKWFDQKNIDQPERMRLSGAMAQSRQALTGYKPKGGCAEVKLRIGNFYAMIG